MLIRRRWPRIVLIGALQALVLATASAVIVSWMHSAMSASSGGEPLQSAQIDARANRAITIAIALASVLIAVSTALTMAIVASYERRVGEITQSLEKLADLRSSALMKSRHAVIFGLAKLAESRDDQTGQHLERIRSYVQMLAHELAATDPTIDRTFIDVLVETSSLHDIGKVGIPDAILLKPGRLSSSERDMIRRHPLIGGDTLLAIRRVWGDDPFLITACEVAFSHHERWDGSGYPFGLAGENIPVAGRIVALADVYDALTSDRVYKSALSHDSAREIITSSAGAHFDPKVVQAFLARESEFRDALLNRNNARPTAGTVE